MIRHLIFIFKSGDTTVNSRTLISFNNVHRYQSQTSLLYFDPTLAKCDLYFTEYQSMLYYMTKEGIGT
jgi:hypothetical protein